jgi:signal transduction histidine kinase
MLARIDRVLSLGQTDAVPARLARHVRVTNALALLGVSLSLLTVPLDVYGRMAASVLVDLIAAAVFASCWYSNARGRYNAARVTLMLAANGVILGGLMELGGGADLRTVYFPLALLPFLVLSLSEWCWLSVFVAMPVIGYYLTGRLADPAPGFVIDFYNVYAPALAFTTIITASIAFASIERDSESKLLEARARAAQGARLVALGEMSSGIAHEIRNPLAAIHLAAGQIAEASGVPPQVAQLGERIQRIVMRASNIIDALRSFARDASTDPFVVSPVERILADTLELCGKRLTEQGVALTIGKFPADLVIECRPVQLCQVLVNLLGNAYDAVSAASERWVHIEVKTDDEHIEIDVTDSGPGIPAAVKPHIFEPFFTTKTPDRGTGLGLSLSRGLVEAHHGTLELDTASAHTCFVLRLPRAQPAAARA